jgi:hypothetical protein
MTPRATQLPFSHKFAGELRRLVNFDFFVRVYPHVPGRAAEEQPRRGRRRPKQEYKSASQSSRRPGYVGLTVKG